MHPHDLSRLLAHLVEVGFLESDKRGRGTSYRFPGTADLHQDAGLNSSKVSSSHSMASSSHLALSSSHLAPSSSQMGLSSPHADPGAGLRPEADPGLLAVASRVRSKGRAKEDEIRTTVLELCRGRFLTLQQLAGLLGRSPANFRNRFLSPMVQAHQLEWRYPTNPNHEQQAYRTVEAE